MRLTSIESIIAALDAHNKSATRSVTTTEEALKYEEFSDIDAKLDKYFDFIQSKVSDIAPDHRENFKKNLWKLFIERSVITKDPWKGNWSIDCIRETGYFLGTLRGFCFGMEHFIANQDKPIEEIITPQFLIELHRVMLTDVKSEVFKTIGEGVVGQYAGQANSISTVLSNGTMSLNYLLQAIEDQKSDQDAKLKMFVEEMYGPTAICFSRFSQIYIKQNSVNNCDVTLELRFQDMPTRYFTRNNYGDEMMQDLINANLVEKNDYLAFASQALAEHPYLDGNGRVFNHILCHLYSIWSGKMPYLMWHDKSHEFLTRDEMEVMRVEGTTAFQKLVLEDQSLALYAQEDKFFARFISEAVEMSANFVEENLQNLELLRIGKDSKNPLPTLINIAKLIKEWKKAKGYDDFQPSVVYNRFKVRLCEEVPDRTTLRVTEFTACLPGSAAVRSYETDNRLPNIVNDKKNLIVEFLALYFRNLEHPPQYRHSDLSTIEEFKLQELEMPAKKKINLCPDPADQWQRKLSETLLSAQEALFERLSDQTINVILDVRERLFDMKVESRSVREVVESSFDLIGKLHLFVDEAILASQERLEVRERMGLLDMDGAGIIMIPTMVIPDSSVSKGGIRQLKIDGAQIEA